MDRYAPFQAGHAVYYDEFHRRDKPYAAECAFVAEALARFGVSTQKTILDLGCGTGGHVIGLTQRGYYVMGVDSAPEMLAVARRNAERAKVEVELRLGDAKTVDLEQRFECVVAFYNVINYFLEDEELGRLLANVRRHLAPDGLFVFDYRNAFPALTQYSRETVHEVARNGRRVVLISRNNVDALQQMFLTDYTGMVFEGDRLVERFEERHRLRLFVPREIAFQLKVGGFHVLHTCAFPRLDEPMDAVATWHVAVVAAAGDGPGNRG